MHKPKSRSPPKGLSMLRTPELEKTLKSSIDHKKIAQKVVDKMNLHMLTNLDEILWELAQNTSSKVVLLFTKFQHDQRSIESFLREYIEIARILHTSYQVFQEKESRRLTYRSRLLEEFIICAYYQALYFGQTEFCSTLRLFMMHIHKNFVILSDMLIEQESMSISARQNFLDFKNLISKRKTYFDIKSTFQIEERYAKISESFETVRNFLVQRTNPASDLSFSQPNSALQLESLLHRVVSTIMSDDMKSREKEARLCEFYAQIRLDYRQIAGVDLNESQMTGRSTASSARHEKENLTSAITGAQLAASFKQQSTKTSTAEVSRTWKGDSSPDQRTPDFKTGKESGSSKSPMSKGILRNGTQTAKFEGNTLEVVTQNKVSLVPEVPILLPSMHPRYKYTLVLDLDETLVHYDEIHQHFYVRPHARDFLKRFGKVFEIIIYTAATKDVNLAVTQYADEILDRLDDSKVIQHRLCRDHLELDKAKGKDLRVLGRDLSRVIFIDDNPLNFQRQPENGIRIKEFHDDENDQHLLELSRWLERR